MTADPRNDAPLRFTLPPSRRLRRAADFRRVYLLRASAAGDPLVVYAARNDLDFSRLGVSVGRKHGRSVLRNRLKRMLREAFRLSRHRLPVGYDFVLIPRDFSGVTLARLLELLPEVARRAAGRADRKPGRPKRGEGA